jgi:tetratricopeptide (TPR) repeat protein
MSLAFHRRAQTISAQVNDFKQGFVAAMVAVAEHISDSPTLQQIQAVAPTMPHVAEVAKDKDLRNFLRNEDLVSPFVGLGRFYQGQGLYDEAEPWYEQRLSLTQARFGSDHLHIATSLNNLASLYNLRGRYSEAEPIHMQSLELRKRILGENHPDVANSMNNLGRLYYYQGRYFEAESLFLQAVEVYQKGLRLEHPEAVNSRENLAIVRDRLNSTATDLPNFNHKAKKGGSKKKSKGFGKG